MNWFECFIFSSPIICSVTYINRTWCCLMQMNDEIGNYRLWTHWFLRVEKIVEEKKRKAKQAVAYGIGVNPVLGTQQTLYCTMLAWLEHGLQLFLVNQSCFFCPLNQMISKLVFTIFHRDLHLSTSKCQIWAALLLLHHCSLMTLPSILRQYQHCISLSNNSDFKFCILFSY